LTRGAFKSVCELDTSCLRTHKLALCILNFLANYHLVLLDCCSIWYCPLVRRALVEAIYFFSPGSWSEVEDFNFSFHVGLSRQQFGLNEQIVSMNDFHIPLCNICGKSWSQPTFLSLIVQRSVACIINVLRS
jgi:hypothetical protein